MFGLTPTGESLAKHECSRTSSCEVMVRAGNVRKLRTESSEREERQPRKNGVGAQLIRQHAMLTGWRPDHPRCL
jgi:hypothetical protein